ncbi:Stp1/IreP family PP2C-type Ser/Thr phosphatase [Alteribacter populi]|uniref:Stp1/IreP family PP2C-type Ser/Thr phosphatase n=1 Tax=Alteribacter populi TaxID=2011011 RepID=UPI000BBAF608|nr:Stp1/IreP family PP2C-type Ser/Thr phosphatase [Alteribacter populi]
MDAVFKTDVGQTRAHNEDDGAFAVNSHGQVLVLVADGMGGHQAGDVASQMTKESLLKKWLDTDNFETPKEAEQWLSESVQRINGELYDHAQHHTDCQGMGTTIVAALCTHDFITIAHVGDSRVYLSSAQGFRQLTGDHSLVGELVRSGQISEDEAMNHPRRNVVLRALGTEAEVKIDLETIDWDEGSYLLLCTDGLTDKVSNKEIEKELLEGRGLTETVDSLIQIANDRGGEDNVTIAIVRLETENEGGEQS